MLIPQERRARSCATASETALNEYYSAAEAEKKTEGQGHSALQTMIDTCMAGRNISKELLYVAAGQDNLGLHLF